MDRYQAQFSSPCTRPVTFLVSRQQDLQNQIQVEILISKHLEVRDILNPIQTEGGLLRPYQTLKFNKFKTVKAMTTNFSDFS